MVPNGTSDEQLQAIREKAQHVYGLDHDVEVVRADEVEDGVPAQAVMIDEPDGPLYLTPLYHGYTPYDRPSKKQLRTSPYAKFDKFHKKKRK